MSFTFRRYVSRSSKADMPTNWSGGYPPKRSCFCFFIFCYRFCYRFGGPCRLPPSGFINMYIYELVIAFFSSSFSWVAPHWQSQSASEAQITCQGLYYPTISCFSERPGGFQPANHRRTPKRLAADSWAASSASSGGSLSAKARVDSLQWNLVGGWTYIWLVYG